MLDADTYKKLQAAIGAQGAGKGQVSALFALQGSKAAKVKAEFLKIIPQRNMPGTHVEELRINDVVFYLVKKTFQPGEEAISAVRIEPYGNDLDVSIHHFEASQKAFMKRRTWGYGLLVGGILIVWSGIGMLAAIIGFLMLRSKGGLPNAADQQASYQHNDMVIDSLSMALENCEINTNAQLKATKITF
jgi:hypothetical protein